MSNALNWFEIPAADYARAKKFYETILGIEMKEMVNAETFKMAAFPGDWKKGETAGGVAWGEWYKPSTDGTLVYLNGGTNLEAALARVEPAGGKVLQTKKSIGEYGFIALFIDTEGNRIALHSQN